MTESMAAEMVCCLPGPESLCASTVCMAWRWRPLMADDAFLNAVKTVMNKLMKEKKMLRLPAHNEAVKIVTKDRKGHGLPDKPFEGWCGLAGEPVNK